jgi:DnaJ-class molecular chaperone
MTRRANGTESLCGKCRGRGEIVVASHYVGDGAYNDDFDTCPVCKGTGIAPVTPPC